MKEFPASFTPQGLAQSRDAIITERYLAYLRKDLYEHTLTRHSEADYFEVDKFQKRYSLPKDLVQQLVQRLVTEVRAKGWTCELSYGKTAIFVMADPNNPPLNYFREGV